MLATLEKPQSSLFALNANYRLWVYAVLVVIYNPKTGKTKWVVKFGDHRCNTREEAHRYATTDGNTVGKLQGLVGGDIFVIAVEDVTDVAVKLDPAYDPTQTEENIRKGFDNRMRDSMPGKSRMHVNIDGGRSLELHIMDDEDGTLTFERCEYLWKTAIETYKNGGNPIKKATYIARPYLVESFDKTSGSQEVYKHLLAAATGAGKETSTLALIIHLHDTRRYSNKKIHCAVATIPSTTSELFNELATVAGMDVGDYGYVDFSQIKPYITKQWHDSYLKDCSPAAQDYIRKNATIIKTVSEIPVMHKEGIVPVLFGSFHHLSGGEKDAISGKVKPLHKSYAGLEKRIGILAIGEAHQMLSNADNKMWKNLNSVFGSKCFKLFITGTPYDFIYGNAAAEFFGVDERSLFTRNDLYKDKRNNPNSHYKDYPDFNFYGINIRDVVEQLKTDYRWEGDENGFTFNKLFTYDPEKKKFLYEKTILWLFKRMFGQDAFSENGDPLSIYNAPGLCDVAKRNGMVALPVGDKNASARVYIGALKKLLVDNGVFPGDIFDAYDDDLGDRKKDIAEAKGMTLTLTCNKDCTGANIPELGYFVFMRKLGDSVKFFEQATGRVGRKYAGKTNCGVFLADLENSMDIMLAIEQKIAGERDENFSVRYLIKELLANYNFFTGRNGKWEEIDPVDFAKTLEEMSAKGVYGLSMCNRNTKAPAGFELKIKSQNGWEKKKVDLNSNGNAGAKDKKSTKLEQMGFKFTDDKSKDQSWNNMKRNHIARCRKLCYVKGFESLQECVAWIENSIATGDNEAEAFFGIGYDFIPSYMLDDKQIDVVYTNRWINSLHNVADIESLFDLMADKALRDHELDFVPAPTRYARRKIERVLRKFKECNPGVSPTIIDPCAGRGIFLVYAITIAKEIGLDIDSKNVYYNDIDTTWVEFFKQVNKQYKLGIPNKNITCECALTKEYKMRFNIVVGNPAYDASGDSDSIKFWNAITLKTQNEIVDVDGIVAYTTPQTILKATDATIKAKKPTYLIQKNFETKQLLEYDETANEDFDVGIDIASWVWRNSVNNNTITNFLAEDGETKVAKYIAASKVFQSLKDQIIDKVTQGSQKKLTRNRIVQEKSELSKTASATHYVPVVWNARGADLMYSTKKHDARYKLCINNYKAFKITDDNLMITDLDTSPAYFYITGTKSYLKKLQTLLGTKKLFLYVGNNFLNSKGVFLIAQRQEVIPDIDVNREWTDKELYQEFGLDEEMIKAVEDWYAKSFK